jgi:archaellum component FlaF (FlaF/FlaG flagellin family)
MNPTHLAKIFEKLELTKDEYFQFEVIGGKLNISAPLSKVVSTVNGVAGEQKANVLINGEAVPICISKESEQSLLRVLSISKTMELLIPTADPTLPIIVTSTINEKGTAKILCGIVVANPQH